MARRMVALLARLQATAAQLYNAGVVGVAGTTYNESHQWRCYMYFVFQVCNNIIVLWYNRIKRKWRRLFCRMADPLPRAAARAGADGAHQAS